MGLRGSGTAVPSPRSTCTIGSSPRRSARSKAAPTSLTVPAGTRARAERGGPLVGRARLEQSLECDPQGRAMLDPGAVGRKARIARQSPVAEHLAR